MRIFISLLFIISGLFVAIIGYMATIGNADIYNDIRTSEAVRMPVDLSKKGVYKGKFKQKFATEHGKQLRIITEPAFESDEEVVEAIKDFKGNVKIIGNNEQVKLTFKIDIGSFKECRRHIGGCAGYAELSPHTLFFQFPKYGAYNLKFKEYDFVLTVENPATDMKGQKQTLVSKNAYCLTPEGMKNFIFIGISVAGLFITFIGLIIDRRFIKKMILFAPRRKGPATQAEESA